MSALLVIDDEPLILNCFRYLFPETEVTVHTATSASEGLQQFSEHHPDVVILDIHLPDGSGLETFRQIHTLDARVPAILITGQGTAEAAIEAMRLGAYEYVIKPLDPNHLHNLIERALEISRQMRIPAKVADAILSDDQADILIGNSPAMQDVYKSIGRVATQDVTVLIRGESGTGKELVARAIYHHSRRSTGPFLAINCAAIPDTLLESELFGHEQGAFTGADHKRVGKFEQCDGGTLFLDEIGDMTPLTQAKVLRVLQDQRFERVGGQESIKTDVRVIAATSRDLEQMMATGKFRSDLFYRLSVFGIELPPLRERPEDMPSLMYHFLRRFNRELGRDVHTISSDVQDRLQRYDWPGNIRELQSVLKQALVHATGPMLVSEFLPDAFGGNELGSSIAGVQCEHFLQELSRFVENQIRVNPTDLYADVMNLVEQQLLMLVLRQVGSNQSRAARLLGISRTTLRAKLALFEIVGT